MLAVVQIGSKILRSPCSTARTVRAAEGLGCALGKLGAHMVAAVATEPLTNVRRDVAMLPPPRRPCQQDRHFLQFSWLQRFRHGLRRAASAKRMSWLGSSNGPGDAPSIVMFYAAMWGCMI